jgi:hypothetical protein
MTTSMTMFACIKVEETVLRHNKDRWAYCYLVRILTRSAPFQSYYCNHRSPLKKWKWLMLNGTRIWLIQVPCFLEVWFLIGLRSPDEILCPISVCLMSRVKPNINFHLNTINQLKFIKIFIYFWSNSLIWMTFIILFMSLLSTDLCTTDYSSDMYILKTTNTEHF